MAGDNSGSPFPVTTLCGPMIGMFGAMAEWADDASRHRFDQLTIGQLARSLPGGDQQSPLGTDLLQPMGQALMIAANRSLSYWLGLAQILENHQMTLAQVVSLDAIDGRTGRSGRLAVADRLRGLLRDVGDLATREARILQNELNALDESLAQSLQQPEQSSSYQRRWRAKA